MPTPTSTFLGPCHKTRMASLVLVIGAMASAESTLPADIEAEALAADDTCAAGSTGCGLNALQRKGRKFPNLEASLLKPVRSHPLHWRRRPRRKETGMAQLKGAAFADYSVNVTIGSQTFQVIVDTGSSALVVAAAPGEGCWEYYNGPCKNHSITAYYGSGSWRGHVCFGPEVTLAGLSAGTPLFAGIKEQDNFLDRCSLDPSGIFDEGMVGMAYPQLIQGFDGVSLFDSIVKNTGMANVFSMQCCGWQGGKAARGQLVLGGVDPQHYTGEFQFTPITMHLWFCVELVSLYADGDSMSLVEATRMQQHGASTRSRRDDEVQERASQPDCPAIIDSGASAIILTPEHYHRVMNSLQDLLNKTDCITKFMLEAFPNVIIKLGGDVTLSMPPTTYFQPGVSDCYELYISKTDEAPSIFGQPLMEAYYTMFDKENDRIGFAPIAGCNGGVARA